MKIITYKNKVALNENPDIEDINKVKAEDLNEIKEVVNDNFKEIKDIGIGDGVPLGSEFDYDGTTVPTGYEEVDETATYTSKGLSFVFVKKGDIVEVNVTGRLSEAISANENIDFDIDSKFVPSLTKYENQMMYSDTSIYTLIAMSTGAFRWRCNSAKSSGGVHVGHFIYFL